MQLAVSPAVVYPHSLSLDRQQPILPEVRTCIAVLVSRNPGRDHPPGTAQDQCMDRASTVDCDSSLLTQRSSMHAFVASRVAQPCGQTSMKGIGLPE